MNSGLPEHSRLIADAMERQGVSPYLLADLADVSANTVKSAMRGDRDTLPPKLMRIAVALKLDPVVVLRAAGTPEPAIRKLVDVSAPNQLDISDLSDQDRNLVQRVVDALRIQEKHRK